MPCTHTHRYGTHSLTYKLRKRSRRKLFSLQFFLHPLRRPSRRGREGKKKRVRKEKKKLPLSFFLPSFRSFVSFRVCEIRRGLDSIFRSGFSRNRASEWVAGWVGSGGVSSPAPTNTALHCTWFKIKGTASSKGIYIKKSKAVSNPWAFVNTRRRRRRRSTWNAVVRDIFCPRVHTTKRHRNLNGILLLLFSLMLRLHLFFYLLFFFSFFLFIFAFLLYAVYISL